MRKLSEKPELSNNDHVFSKWLFDNNWNGKTNKVITGRNAMSEYVTDGGEIICKVVYDNHKCTYTVFG